MPVYNAEAFVAEAVESVLRQTLADLELIAVDDGSTDGSLGVLRQLARSDDRVQVISRPNCGIGQTRNDALAASKGQYIANLDADDIAEPRRLEVQIAHMRDHPECVLLGCHVMDIDPDGALLGPTSHRLEHEEIDSELLEGRGSAIWQSTSVMRRSDVEAVGGYIPEFSPSEDLDLFLKLAERGRLRNLSDVLVRMRRHPASATALRTQEEAMALRTRIVREALERRGRGGEVVRLRAFAQPRSLAAWHAGWAHVALRNGFRRTALKHLGRAVRREPLCREVWRVAVDAALGVQTGQSIRHWIRTALGRTRKAVMQRGAMHEPA
jgi:glycosyltransferase involved in cell wall biosynthesis